MSPIVAAAVAFGGALVVAILLYLAFVTFNSLVALRQQVDKAWANIDVALRQRHDELPNLVQAVRGQLAFEQATLQRVTEARAAWSPDASIPRKATVSEATSRAVHGLFAVVERYPGLRSDSNVMALQAEIQRLETVIADRRELYNDSANRYNTTIAQLPGVLVASALGWQRRPFFTAEPGDELRPSTALDPDEPDPKPG